MKIRMNRNEPAASSSSRNSSPPPRHRHTYVTEPQYGRIPQYAPYSGPGSYAANSHAVEADVLRHLTEAMETRRQHKKGQLFPSDLITKGSDRKVLGKGEATSAEFMLGLLRLELHESTREADVAALRRFTLNVATDTCRLPWPVVRQYAEDTFGAIADGTIPGGWANDAAIAGLRTDGIAISSHGQSSNHQHPQKSYGGPQTQQEKKKYSREMHGTPCPQFAKGESRCDKAEVGGNHKIGDKKVCHACGYCANVRNVYAMHSEADCICKNKANRPDFP